MLAPDLPAFGLTEAPDGFVPSFDGYADWLERFTVAMGVELQSFWADPTPEGREQLAANVSEDGSRDEFIGELPEHLAARVPPDLWNLHWALINTPRRRADVVRLFEDQGSTLADFPAQQAYLRRYQPPTLTVGPTRRVHARGRRPRLPP